MTSEEILHLDMRNGKGTKVWERVSGVAAALNNAFLAIGCGRADEAVKQFASIAMFAEELAHRLSEARRDDLPLDKPRPKPTLEPCNPIKKSKARRTKTPSPPSSPT